MFSSIIPIVNVSKRYSVNIKKYPEFVTSGILILIYGLKLHKLFDQNYKKTNI